MKELNYKSDPRFVLIGDLPSGFIPYSEKELWIRPFALTELSLIHQGRSTNSIHPILRAIDFVISMNVFDLTDGDLEFIMAWLRLKSYPDTPITVNWLCNKRNLVQSDGSFYETKEPSSIPKHKYKELGLHIETCDTENNELVYNAETTIHHLDDEFKQLPQLDSFINEIQIDWPRVNTLDSYLSLIKEQPDLSELAETARWIQQGNTLQDKLDILLAQSSLDLWLHIQTLIKTYELGCSETVTLRCRTCDNTLIHTARINKLTYFANNTDQGIMNIKYRLMSVFNVLVPSTMSSQELLYYHSCLLKDEQDEANRRAMVRK
jgi:hypothetical protein